MMTNLRPETGFVDRTRGPSTLGPSLSQAWLTPADPMSLAHRLFSGTSQLTISSGLCACCRLQRFRFSRPSSLQRHTAQRLWPGRSFRSYPSLRSQESTCRTRVLTTARNLPRERPWSTTAGASRSEQRSITGLIAGAGWWLVALRSRELESGLGALVASGVVLSVLHSMAGTRARLAGRYRGDRARNDSLRRHGCRRQHRHRNAFWRRDVLALLIPMLLGYLLPVIFLGTPSLSSLIGPSGLKRNEGIALVKIGIGGIVTAPMYWLLSSSDRWFLQIYHGAETVGIYSIGYSVAIIGMMINSAVMSVWLPEATQEYERSSVEARRTLGRLMSRLVAAMGLIWLAATAAGGDAVRWLANERFHSAIDVVPFIAGGVFFYGVSLLAMHTMVLVNQLKWAAAWWFVGGLISLALNLSLVPRLGMIGAAWTQTISFFLISAAILVTSQVKYALRLEWARLAAAAALTLTAGILMIPGWHESAPVSLAIKFPFGVLVSMAVAVLIAPDWVSRGMRLILGNRTRSR
jgi:hypothetical protein